MALRWANYDVFFIIDHWCFSKWAHQSNWFFVCLLVVGAMNSLKLTQWKGFSCRFSRGSIWKSQWLRFTRKRVSCKSFQNCCCFHLIWYCESFPKYVIDTQIISEIYLILCDLVTQWLRMLHLKTFDQIKQLQFWFSI